MSEKTCGQCKNWNPDLIVSCELLKWFDQNNYVVTYTNAPVSGDTACPAFAPKDIESAIEAAKGGE